MINIMIIPVNINAIPNIDKSNNGLESMSRKIDVIGIYISSGMLVSMS